VAVQGGEVVSQVVETMKDINDRQPQQIADIIGCHRWHCLSDQHPGAQRSRGSGARR
jgi:hypothetical protein